ncbi:MAG: hypothetical protein ABR875_00570 [Minisyncoccia bacterium]
MSKKRGVDLRRSVVGENDQPLAEITFVSPTQNDPGMQSPQSTDQPNISLVAPAVSDLANEPTDVIKQRITERIARLKAGSLGDDDLATQIDDLQNEIGILSGHLADLKGVQNNVNPEIFKLAVSTMQSEIDLGRTEISTAILRQPTVVARMGERNRRIKLAVSLLARIPEGNCDVGIDTKSASNKLVEILEAGVAGGIFFNPPTNSDLVIKRDDGTDAESRIVPILNNGQYFLPNAEGVRIREVVNLFAALDNLQAAIKEAKSQNWKQRNESAATFVAKEENIRQEASDSGDCVVSFYDLIRTTGLGRIAFVPMFFRENEASVGKIVITRRANNKLVAIKATTTVAAEVMFRQTFRDRQDNKVKTSWHSERELPITISDGKPDFLAIGFAPIKISLEHAYYEVAKRQEAFDAELKAQCQLLDTEGQISIEDLIAGEKGSRAVHIRDWTGNDGRNYHLVLTFAGDGHDNMSITEATTGTLKAAPFLRDYLGKTIPKDQLFRDKRIWSILATVRNAELSHRVKEILESSPEVRNLFRDKQAFADFITTKPGLYFFGFEWRMGDIKAWANAILRVEDSKIFVDKTIGHFSDEFFRPISSNQPIELAAINGRIQKSLSVMARHHFGADSEEIPDFLREKRREDGFISLTGTPETSPTETSTEPLSEKKTAD